MSKILAVAGDSYLLETMLVQIGREGGYDVRGADSLAAARLAWGEMNPDLVIVDADLNDGEGDGDGRAFCRWIRNMNATIPILMLTESAGAMEAVEELTAGANDYIPKPIHFAELMARIETYLARIATHDNAHITLGGFHFSHNHKTLIHIASGKVIPLTEKETAMLEHFHANKTTISKETLLKAVWGYSNNVNTHTVETHIYRLRRKIYAVDSTPLIITAEGGYRLA